MPLLHLLPHVVPTPHERFSINRHCCCCRRRGRRVVVCRNLMLRLLPLLQLLRVCLIIDDNEHVTSRWSRIRGSSSSSSNNSRMIVDC